MRQRTYTTVSAIRCSLKDALSELFDALVTLASLYSLSIGKPILSVSADDGVLSDSESIKDAWREDVKCGIITPDEFKARWYK